MTTQNSVTIYSNGIADFRRIYPLQAGENREVLLAVKRRHVADVLASLCVFGDVRLAEPPTFSPTDNDREHLSIDPGNAMESLLRQLSGARIRLDRAAGALSGRLIGMHSEPEGTGGEKIVPRFFTVLTEQGVTKCPLRDFEFLVFEEEHVKAEIDKALQRNLEQIQPEATQVRFRLEANSRDSAPKDNAATAMVQYTVPAAAWKISYRLREGENSWRLQGLAIVDNNTDEDWNDFRVAVVTGDPITFETDLAEAKTPKRSRINVVQDKAIGAVEVEAPIMMAAMAAPASGRKMRKRAMSRSAPMADAEFDEMAIDFTETAMASDTTQSEVGDFSIFESNEPVSIGAGRSAVIPMFETDFAGAEFVLYYKEADHPERPFRALRFTNEAGHALGRGVCTVFQTGVYAGSCVMPNTKPSEQRLLPHALETGVKVLKEPGQTRESLTRLVFSEGVCKTTQRSVTTTDYIVRSSRSDGYDLLIDYPRRSKGSKVHAEIIRGDSSEAATDPEKITFALRYQLPLSANETVTLRVIEHEVRSSRIDLARDLNTHWLRRNIFAADGPLEANAAIATCLEIQGEIDSLSTKIDKLKTLREALEQRQERLRKNIQVGGHDQQSTRWRAELGTAEERITAIDEQEIPQLEKQISEQQEKLRAALKAIDAEWSGEFDI